MADHRFSYVNHAHPLLDVVDDEWMRDQIEHSRMWTAQGVSMAEQRANGVG